MIRVGPRVFTRGGGGRGTVRIPSPMAYKSMAKHGEFCRAATEMGYGDRERGHLAKRIEYSLHWRRPNPTGQRARWAMRERPYATARERSSLIRDYSCSMQKNSDDQALRGTGGSGHGRSCGMTLKERTSPLGRRPAPEDMREGHAEGFVRHVGYDRQEEGEREGKCERVLLGDVSIPGPRNPVS